MEAQPLHKDGSKFLSVFYVYIIRTTTIATYVKYQ